MNTTTSQIFLYDILVEQGIEKDRARKAVDAFITRVEAEKELATKSDIHELELKLTNVKSSIIQWVAAMLVAQAAAIVALQSLVAAL